MATNRVFLIVLDSFGIGGAPDAAAFGDEGSDTLRSIAASRAFDTPNLGRLGLFNIDGVRAGAAHPAPTGAFARMQEASRGKDTTIGHWEIAGLVSRDPLPTYPDGFPPEILDAFSKATGRGVLCNKPYSGTDVIRDYGRRHVESGDLIVYTSADSVFQVAAHEAVVPPKLLYRYCEAARAILGGAHGVGRVIARPFDGDAPYRRTANRHDFSLPPPRPTMLDALQQAGLDTIGVGKISDIFAGRGIGASRRIQNNEDGMEKTIALQETDFRGLCFVNLVDFDMVYGHRRDVEGYARAATVFDRQLGHFMAGMRAGDVLMITADHGCDPGYAGTDHTRECAPLLACGPGVRPGVNLGARPSFADIAATVLELLNVRAATDGASFAGEITNS